MGVFDILLTTLSRNMHTVWIKYSYKTILIFRDIVVVVPLFLSLTTLCRAPCVTRQCRSAQNETHYQLSGEEIQPATLSETLCFSGQCWRGR